MRWCCGYCNESRLSCKWRRSQTSCVNVFIACDRSSCKLRLLILLNKFIPIWYVFDLSFALFFFHPKARRKKNASSHWLDSARLHHDMSAIIVAILSLPIWWQRNFISFFKSDSTNWFILPLIWKVVANTSRKQRFRLAICFGFHLVWKLLVYTNFTFSVTSLS